MDPPGPWQVGQVRNPPKRPEWQQVVWAPGAGGDSHFSTRVPGAGLGSDSAEAACHPGLHPAPAPLPWVVRHCRQGGGTGLPPLRPLRLLGRGASSSLLATLPREAQSLKSSCSVVTSDLVAYLHFRV